MKSTDYKSVLQLPPKFKSKLAQDSKLDSIVTGVLSNFSEFLEENTLFFFEEFTNHGFKHIQQLLLASEEIITPGTVEKLLSAKDVACLVISIILHDLGMHTSFSMFKNMIDGAYDNIRIFQLDTYTWKEQWDEYFEQAKRFNGKERYRIFGDPHVEINMPNLTNRDALNGIDRLSGPCP